MFQVKEDWKTEIKNYILMGFNAEGVKEENALKQVEIIWDCIEPVIEKLLCQEKEKLLEKIRLEKKPKIKGNNFDEANRRLGYNQAIADLERLKNQLKDKKQKRSPKIVKNYEKRRRITK